MNIQYFFITDRVAQGNVSLVWCPAGDMIGDFSTKPLQGALFRKFRDHIMGVIPAQDPGPGKGELRKGKESLFLSLALSVGQHHRSVLGKVKNVRWTDVHTRNILEMRVHATVIRWDDGYIGS